MNLTAKIAWRNILRHRGKSVIIGVILFIGSFLMTVGNGVISGMEKGLMKNIIDSFTGDIVVISDKNETDSILLEMMGKSVEPINDYRDIKAILKAEPSVDKFLPAGKNMAMSLYEGGMAPGFAFLVGVDIAEYRHMFPSNFDVIEGRMLEPGEKGMLVPADARKEYFDYTGIWLVPKDGELKIENLPENERANAAEITIRHDAVFMGAAEGNTSTDIRLDVTGVVRYKALNTIWGHFTITDIESYRECMGYLRSGEKLKEVPADKKKLLEMENSNIDSLFGDGSMYARDTGASDPVGLAARTAKAPVAISPEDLENGTYNMVFVKLKPGADPGDSIASLNRIFSAQKKKLRAVSWKKASGAIGSMTTIIKGSLFFFVTLLFFVAIIIIVNTLSMAAIERTSEIGMMRAIGARKGFISRMFLAETGALSAVFGGAGIAAGIAAVKLLPLFNIRSQNDMVQLIFGGDRFLPHLSVSDITLTVFQLVLVTLIAVIYPVRVAQGITPLDAISRE